MENNKKQTLQETLEERKRIYGPYREGCVIRIKLMEVIIKAYLSHHNAFMPELYVEYFRDIMNKLSRLAISPDHKDSWHDIAGYATRIEEFIEEGPKF